MEVTAWFLLGGLAGLIVGVPIGAWLSESVG